MATREVKDCDMCGVRDIRRESIEIQTGKANQCTVTEDLDLCAECGAMAFAFVAPAIDPEMAESLLEMIRERRARGEFEPL